MLNNQSKEKEERDTLLADCWKVLDNIIEHLEESIARVPEIINDAFKEVHVDMTAQEQNEYIAAIMKEYIEKRTELYAFVGLLKRVATKSECTHTAGQLKTLRAYLDVVADDMCDFYDGISNAIDDRCNMRGRV